MNRQKARWGLIEIEGSPVGLVQIFENGLCNNLFHAIILDRGPLWFEGCGSDAHFESFIKTFRQEFPKRWGRKIRFIPELANTRNIDPLLRSYGFQRQGTPAYQTIWLDLRPDMELIKKGFSKGWRNSVQKAERSQLSIEWDDKTRSLAQFLQFYEIDKSLKNYSGPSARFLSLLGKSCAPQKNMIIGRALRDGKEIAAILIVCHGSSATYQVGWTLDEGRKTAAHQFLLARALPMLKEKGIMDFDLGGVNDETAAGVKKFKAGLGGEAVTLSGLFT